MKTPFKFHLTFMAILAIFIQGIPIAEGRVVVVVVAREAAAVEPAAVVVAAACPARRVEALDQAAPAHLEATRLRVRQGDIRVRVPRVRLPRVRREEVPFHDPPPAQDPLSARPVADACHRHPRPEPGRQSEVDQANFPRLADPHNFPVARLPDWQIGPVVELPIDRQAGLKIVRVVERPSVRVRVMSAISSVSLVEQRQVERSPTAPASFLLTGEVIEQA